MKVAGAILYIIMHPLLALILGLVFLLVLTAWSMKRLSRARVLRTLAALMRRGLPLESSLYALAGGENHAGEAAISRSLAGQLSRGEKLHLALLRQRIITRQQAAALSMACEKGTGAATLEMLAEQTATAEHRTLNSLPLIVYPLLMGFVLLSNILFLSIFVFPKFYQMILEIGGKNAVQGEHIWLFALAAYLILWGLLALSLRISTFGRVVWWYVPFIGQTYRMEEQARFARTLSLTLSAGATMEEAVQELVIESAGGSMQRSLTSIGSAIEQGFAPGEAFRKHGEWRQEILWALSAVSKGARPALAFEQVSEVLDQKVRSRFIAMDRIFGTTSVLLAAVGVGMLSYEVFKLLTDVAGVAGP